MTVHDAVAQILKAGAIACDGQEITLRIKKNAMGPLKPAIDTLRREKQSALQLLSSGAGTGHDLDLGSMLRSHALELWSDTAGGRLFIVADEADAAQLQERRGEVLTVSELKLVVQISDPGLAAEVLRWKRAFDGTLSESRQSGP